MSSNAPARVPRHSPRSRVGLVCSSMRNFLAGVIGGRQSAHGEEASFNKVVPERPRKPPGKPSFVSFLRIEPSSLGGVSNSGQRKPDWVCLDQDYCVLNPLAHDYPGVVVVYERGRLATSQERLFFGPKAGDYSR